MASLRGIVARPSDAGGWGSALASSRAAAAAAPRELAAAARSRRTGSSGARLPGSRQAVSRRARGPGAAAGTGLPRASPAGTSPSVSPPAAPAAAPAATREPARGLNPSAWQLEAGQAEPLGASLTERGINFSVWSGRASKVTLVVSSAENEELRRFELSKGDGGVWSGLVVGEELGEPTGAGGNGGGGRGPGCSLAPGLLYGYLVDGPRDDPGARWSGRILLDPYAKGVWGRKRFGEREGLEAFESPAGSTFRGIVEPARTVPEFDWEDDDEVRPRIPLRDLVIYELPVRTFTASPTSGVTDPGARGTFAGLAEKISHLEHLGVNAVELLPVFEYDELEFQRFENPRDHMVNVWGYSHLNFFAPMSRFGTAPDAGAGGVGGGVPPPPQAALAAYEFKSMVKKLHAAGIEVILDVVYNHTAEGGDELPYELSWRGIDCEGYYQMTRGSGGGGGGGGGSGGSKEIVNWSGCGNTFSGNEPRGMQMVLDSLRHWVTEYRVDGFRFDLAPCLCRDRHGEPVPAPPLIEAIARDPVLARAHIIAEPWDLGLYQVGTFPNWDAWSEWNGKFRDDVRGFVRGDPGKKKAFATRVAGSADLYRYNARKPSDSINFVVCHDGFTLHDLVSYDSKRNDANGEFNRDGTSDNVSWNCGAEGETSDPGVQALRSRQARNLHLALMVSQGTPMLLAGDEYLQTRWGNNNWYGHDTDLTWFDWDALERSKETGWYDFYRGLVRFRRVHALLGRDEFLTPNDVSWHEDRWDDDGSRFLAWTLHDRGQGDGDLYIAFNAHGFAVRAGLPPPPSGARWYRVVDTNLPAPDDFVEHGVPGIGETYEVQAHSAIMLLAKRSL